jgi:hypothetical protein
MHQTMAAQREAAQTIPAYVPRRVAQCPSTGCRVMTQPDRAPSPLRRAAAAAALVALVVALLYLAISAIFRWYILLTSVISLGVLVVAVWFILSRPGLARAIAAVVAAVALVTFVGVVLATESLIVLTVGLGLAAVSIVASSYALSPISAEVADHKRAPRAHHPVLLMKAFPSLSFQRGLATTSRSI